MSVVAFNLRTFLILIPVHALQHGQRDGSDTIDVVNEVHVYFKIALDQPQRIRGSNYHL